MVKMKENGGSIVVFALLLLAGVGLYITSALIGPDDAMSQAATGLIGAAIGGAGALLKNGSGR